MNYFLLLLYNIALKIYYLGVFITSFFNEKAKKWIAGRKDIFQNIEYKISEIGAEGSKLIWFHCSSLGEFEQGRPVMEKCKSRFAGCKIILTFFSPSGYEVRKNYHGADAVFYLPLDSRKNAERFIALAKPQLAIFVKYEFWHYYLDELNKKNIPCLLVSAKFRAGQVFFRWYGMLFRNLLKKFSRIFVQDAHSLRLLESIEVKNASIALDTRFDRVLEISQQVKPHPIIEKFRQDKIVFIGGSTWQEDEQILFALINSSTIQPFSNFKFIIAPHEIEEDHIQSLLQQFSQSKIIRYSQADENNVQDKTVLIIDNIGMLSSLYQYGSMAMIGGGFGKGIHNILEAAVFGLPVFFGPNFKKFNEAIGLVKTGGAFVVTGATDLERKVSQLLTDESAYRLASDTCRNYVQSKRGGTDAILQYISSSGIFS